MAASPPAAVQSLPLAAHLRRQRLAWAWRLLALAGFAALCWADHRGWFYYPGSDASRFEGRPATVLDVPDGNTLVAALPDSAGQPTRVRLLGTTAVGNGREARALIRRDTLGQTIRLHLPAAPTRTARGELWALVELPDGTSLNATLLTAGLVRADMDRDQPRLEEFLTLERTARHDHAGLWARHRPQSAAAPVR